ncbi:MAG: HIT family protein [Patescibacteria group bacterium]|jgi:histidine triad (HIT) family protein|nr:HIT family protein [Patescibacteria group bacterium]
MTDCIFCKIVNKEINSHKIYENDAVLAFLDVLPMSSGHTIVIPKEHISDMESISDTQLAEMTRTIKLLGKAMIEGLGVEGYSVFLDNKSAANQHVPHIHFHVVPRKEGDGFERWAQSAYEEGEAEFVATKISREIS